MIELTWALTVSDKKWPVNIYERRLVGIFAGVYCMPTNWSAAAKASNLFT